MILPVLFSARQDIIGSGFGRRRVTTLGEQKQTTNEGGLSFGHAMGKDRFAITKVAYWCRRNVVVVSTNYSLVLDVSSLWSKSIDCM